MKRGGFTLIELVVVLAILALLTHLALRELGQVQTAHRRQAADRQLEEIREAVWSEVKGGEPTGFLVDMGRLPRACAETNEMGRTVLTAAELWRRPGDVGPFAVRTATASNLVGSASLRAALADETVKIPCGWRGPYLRLPLRAARLLDAWGNPMETPDDAGFARLEARGAEPLRENGEIARVRHLGMDARPDDVLPPQEASARDGRVVLGPEGGLSNDLSVAVSFVDATGPVGVSGEVGCRWYMPCGGAITGGVAQVSLTGGSFTTFSFTGLPSGVCTVTVRIGGTTCALERLVVPPGGRAAALKVLVK